MRPEKYGGAQRCPSTNFWPPYYVTAAITAHFSRFAAGELPGLSRQVAVLFPGDSGRRLAERPSQPFVATTRRARDAFAGTFVVAGTQPRPGS